MFSLEDTRKVSEILEWDKSKLDAAIHFIFEEYAGRSMDNAFYLLRLVNRVCESAIRDTTDKKLIDYQVAAEMLVPQVVRRNKDNLFFTTMVPVCKLLFPNGNAHDRSEADQAYFKLFRELLEKNYDPVRDKPWADTMGYTEYLERVRKKD